MAGDDFRSALDDLEKGAHAGAQVHAAGAPGDDPGVAHPSVTALRERFGEAVLGHQVMAGDEHVVFIAPERIRDVLMSLRDDQLFDLLVDVTAVDFGGGRPLQVVYELWSIPRKLQLRVKAELPLDRLEIASAAPIWSTANWLEREVYDMFGITFDGHPDLRRILMPENYAEGHPLRKDFPLRGRFSRAEQTRRALAMEVEDFYIPSELDVMRKGGGATAGPGAAAFTGGTRGERAPGASPEERGAPGAAARDPDAPGEGPASGEDA